MSPPAEGPSPRILVVEDDPDTRALLHQWLALTFKTVVDASNGRQALQAARVCRFEVVVTDLMMPGMDGLQLLAFLKQLDPDVEVIFLSGAATIDDAIAALREGNAFDFLTKPLHRLERLTDAVWRAIARRNERLATRRLLADMAERPAHVEPLSPRETEVLALMAEGLANRAIAQRLGVAEKTIKNHLTHIYEKLKVERRTEALAAVYRYRLLDGRAPG
jgi:DNA-binding NarL/FixJ family response regulator